MKNNYCVYCHISPDGKRYIGVTCRNPIKRWNYGKGYVGNSYFTRAIEKYGWDSFQHIILCEGLTRQGASDLEKKFIEYYQTTDRSKGYNIELGGLRSEKELSEETKRKIGDSHRGRYTEAQWEATRNRKPLNYHHTDEAKRKIGDSHRGKPLSDEHKAKLSEAHKGKKLSEPVKENLRQLNMKKVACYDSDGNLIQIYDSITDAANDRGVKSPSISACCRGINKTCCGLLWGYIA